MKVFIVQASHAYVPGEPMTAHKTMRSANREAASLVAIMLKDADRAQWIGSLNASNWKRALTVCNSTRNNPERRDYDVWITPLEVQE